MPVMMNLTRSEVQKGMADSDGGLCQRFLPSKFCCQAVVVSMVAFFSLAAGICAEETAVPISPMISDLPKPYIASTKTAKNPLVWRLRHWQCLIRGKLGPVGLLFLGDSITEYWKNAPEIWETYYGRYQPANFGIAGDRVENVLWRIQNGELDGIDPRVVVLMIGTNNAHVSGSQDIVRGIEVVLEEIQKKLPKTRVLLLAILPRGALPGDSREMTVIKEVNRELSRMDNGETIRYLDLGPKFLGPDGGIPQEVMPDQLHPDKPGYEIWAREMDPLLREMMSRD